MSGRRKTGFTIVELLIVIVVIGIVATISLVSYSGVQSRARDAIRIADSRSIITALELYKVQTGRYPNVATNDPSGWEMSKYTPETFVNSLRIDAVINQATPVDPINLDQMYYKYYRYPAGYANCDATRGAFYVFVVQRFESKSGGGHGPGFSCSGRNWVSEGAWVTGGYTL